MADHPDRRFSYIANAIGYALYSDDGRAVSTVGVESIEITTDEQAIVTRIAERVLTTLDTMPTAPGPLPTAPVSVPTDTGTPRHDHDVVRIAQLQEILLGHTAWNVDGFARLGGPYEPHSEALFDLLVANGIIPTISELAQPDPKEWPVCSAPDCDVAFALKRAITTSGERWMWMRSCKHKGGFKIHHEPGHNVVSDPK